MTLSNFVQRPAQAARELEDAGSIVLTRRGAADLLLQDAEAADREREAFAAPLTLLAALADADVLDGLLGGGVVLAVFPWLELFDADDQRAFLEEYMRAVRVSASLRNPAMLVRVLSAWRASAELLADPQREAHIREGIEEGALLEVKRP